MQYLTQLRKMDLQRLRVIFETKGDHSVEYVLPANGLTFLELAFLGCLARDEADELRDALLHPPLLHAFRFASLAIFAIGGTEDFIMRATLAIWIHT